MIDRSVLLLPAPPSRLFLNDPQQQSSWVECTLGAYDLPIPAGSTNWRDCLYLETAFLAAGTHRLAQLIMDGLVIIGLAERVPLMSALQYSLRRAEELLSSPEDIGW